MDDQRDYAEEKANRDAIMREGLQEIADVAFSATENATTREHHHSLRKGFSDRKSFTAMSPEGICEILFRMEKSGEPYPISFNHQDFWNMLIALRHLHDDPNTSPDLQEWAVSFISGIGETFNVEMI